MSWRVGTDTGGTFTDLIAISDSGEVRVAKVPSTPPDFEIGVVNALREIDLPIDASDVLYHGTTVTTNALLTRSGVRTALLSTRGFRDVLELRHGNRADVFDVMWDQPAPLVPRANRLEIDERLNYLGEVLVELDESQIRDLARILRKRRIEAVGVSLIHSYTNPGHEERIAEILREELPDVYTCISTEIMPQPPEFERTSTVAANAYVGPVLHTYMRKLEGALREISHSGQVRIMHSGGGMMSAAAALSVPIRTAMSGPAAGAVAAAAIGAAAGRQNLVSFDVGGTSADLTMVMGGKPHLSMEYEIEWGMPVGFPSVDVAAIGAGGGSIAWIDEGGAPRSGPQSAGSVPGPACYGRGGDEPTNTDANLLLGRLSPEAFLMEVDPELSRAAVVEKIARPLGLDVHDAAAGIVRISNENMSNAIRRLTVERGLDPREFSLMAFGGAGALHAVELARGLSMREVIVPPTPGATSALGLLFVDYVHDVAHAYIADQSKMDIEAIEGIFERLQAEALEALREEGYAGDQAEIVRSIDLRYAGQVRAVTVPLAPGQITEATIEKAIADFHTLYEREFKYAMEGTSIESRTLRVSCTARTQKPQLEELDGTGDAEQARVDRRPVYFVETEGFTETAIFDREKLMPGASFEGPAIVEQYDTTTVVPPGASAEVDRFGNLIIEPGVEA